MNKFLLLALLFTTSASARDFEETKLDTNLRLCVNDGGVRKCPLVVNGALGTVETSSKWFIEANIGGAALDISTSAVTSYTEMTATTLDMVNNTTKGSDSSAQIPCSATNPPTGLTCAAGNESLGISFIPPHVGVYEVCAYFSWYTSLALDGRAFVNFQLIETPTNAQTLTQEGGGRAASQLYGQKSGSAEQAIGLSTCGFFKFSDTARKVVRLMYEHAPSGSVLDHEISMDRNASIGQRDFLITVKAL